MHRLALTCLVALVVWTPAKAFAEAASDYSVEYRVCLALAGTDADKQIACVKAETARQDVALNNAYKRLTTRLNPYQKQRLKLSERAWIQFRGAECGFRSSVLIGGPLGIQAAAQADAEADCLLRQAYLRAEALKAAYHEAWDGTVPGH